MGMNYYRAIVDMLEGQYAELKDIPRERLDWSGLGAVLELYEKTSGEERKELVHSMSQIIEDTKLPPVVIAQLLHLVTSLDIAEIEPSILKLKATASASKEPVRSAIANFLALRELRLKTL